MVVKKAMPEGQWQGWQKGFFFKGFGIGPLLLIIGLYWLSVEMSWIPKLPIWPIALIIVAVWLISRRFYFNKTCHNKY